MTIPAALEQFIIETPSNPRVVAAGGGPGVCLRFQSQAEQREAFLAAGFVYADGDEPEQTWESLGQSFPWPGVGDVYIAGEFGAITAGENGEIEIRPALPGWHVNIWV
jgi:hypothetical protein